MEKRCGLTSGRVTHTTGRSMIGRPPLQGYRAESVQPNCIITPTCYDQQQHRCSQDAPQRPDTHIDIRPYSMHDSMGLQPPRLGARAARVQLAREIQAKAISHTTRDASATTYLLRTTRDASQDIERERERETTAPVARVLACAQWNAAWCAMTLHCRPHGPWRPP